MSAASPARATPSLYPPLTPTPRCGQPYALSTAPRRKSAAAASGHMKREGGVHGMCAEHCGLQDGLVCMFACMHMRARFGVLATVEEGPAVRSLPPLIGDGLGGSSTMQVPPDAPPGHMPTPQAVEGGSPACRAQEDRPSDTGNRFAAVAQAAFAAAAAAAPPPPSGAAVRPGFMLRSATLGRSRPQISEIRSYSSSSAPAAPAASLASRWRLGAGAAAASARAEAAAPLQRDSIPSHRGSSPCGNSPQGASPCHPSPLASVDGLHSPGSTSRFGLPAPPLTEAAGECGEAGTTPGASATVRAQHAWGTLRTAEPAAPRDQRAAQTQPPGHAPAGAGAPVSPVQPRSQGQGHVGAPGAARAAPRGRGDGHSDAVRVIARAWRSGPSMRSAQREDGGVSPPAASAGARFADVRPGSATARNAPNPLDVATARDAPNGAPKHSTQPGEQRGLQIEVAESGRGSTAQRAPRQHTGPCQPAGDGLSKDGLSKDGAVCVGYGRGVRSTQHSAAAPQQAGDSASLAGVAVIDLDCASGGISARPRAARWQS